MTHASLVEQFMQHSVEKLLHLVHNTPKGTIFHNAAREALIRKGQPAP